MRVIDLDEETSWTYVKSLGFYQDGYFQEEDAASRWLAENDPEVKAAVASAKAAKARK